MDIGCRVDRSEQPLNGPSSRFVAVVDVHPRKSLSPGLPAWAPGLQCALFFSAGFIGGMVGSASARPEGAERSSKRIVFVIDDDVTFRRDVCEALEDAGYITVGAANGRDAIECLTFGSMRPDLIITDLVMPEVDGFELRGWLQSQPRLRDIPLIVMTGHSDATVLSRLRSVAVLRKPFHFDKFMARVAAALKQKAG